MRRSVDCPESESPSRTDHQHVIEAAEARQPAGVTLVAPALLARGNSGRDGERGWPLWRLAGPGSLAGERCLQLFHELHRCLCLLKICCLQRQAGAMQLDRPAECSLLAGLLANEPGVALAQAFEHGQQLLEERDEGTQVGQSLGDGGMLLPDGASHLLQDQPGFDEEAGRSLLAGGGWRWEDKAFLLEIGRQLVVQGCEQGQITGLLCAGGGHQLEQDL
ncbi:hypothetical protein A4R35_01105 [Thermogemmatispora tikiterensis]|uniref:Uncharacterized protein n=1 Tax=Thermogemmatispora tikiterensis TaxID=1825093 RepID=A0A328VEC3_9CHLR|nr:hypothetical protein A4R35_01105 [Thermogemmatispora tikiterensis]